MKHALALLLLSCALCAQESFKTLGQLDDYRRKVNGSYLKALNPIYSKAEKASGDEQAAFVVAAVELKKLQDYMCPTFGMRLAIITERANPELNKKELERLHKIMEDAKIRTTLPATRAELNEAQKFLDAFAKAMQLPVVFTN